MMGKKACTYCLGISSAIFLVLGVIFIAGGTCIYALESPVKVLTNQLEEVRQTYCCRTDILLQDKCRSSRFSLSCASASSGTFGDVNEGALSE